MASDLLDLAERCKEISSRLLDHKGRLVARMGAAMHENYWYASNMCDSAWRSVNQALKAINTD